LGDQQARDAATAGHRAIVFDIPLLVESGRWVRKLDTVVVVDCSTETQIHRVMARNGLQRAAVQAILDTQASRPARRAAADAVVVNDGIALNTLHGHAVQLARLFGL
jgi:dephospho-CoA kinase